MELDSLRLALLVSLWIVLNLTLNVFNKWALSPLRTELSWSESLLRLSVHGPWGGAGFAFPLFYSMCHMLASFVGASLIFLVRPSTNSLQAKHLCNWRSGARLVLLSVLFASNVAANNASLMTLGLAVNQLLKSITPLPVMLFSCALEGKTYSSAMVLAVLLLTTGALVAIPWGSEAADGMGLSLASVSMLAAAGKPALSSIFGREMRRDGLTPLALVWYDALFGSALTGTLCLASHERAQIADYFASKPGLGWFVVVAGSVLAFAYNLVVYALAAQPMVVAVVSSNAKQVVLVVASAIVIDHIWHPLNWFGLAVFFLASFAYSYLALAKQAHLPRAAGKGGRGANVQPAPAASVTWSHKGIVTTASTASESTPLRADRPPRGEAPWYKAGPRTDGSKKGSAGGSGGKTKEVYWALP